MKDCLSCKQISFIVFLVGCIVFGNVWAANRDRELFTAYDACTTPKLYSNCPYNK